MARENYHSGLVTVVSLALVACSGDSDVGNVAANGSAGSEVGIQDTNEASTEKEHRRPTFDYHALDGLPAEHGVSRRDPSDVIQVDGTYYVWYTKSVAGFSGYDASVWYASSADGWTWQEEGEALPRGAVGSWDEYSVFTPNILIADGEYYLFYTAVRPTLGNPERVFENNAENDYTAIGIASARSPDGPFERVGDEPILEVSSDPTAFDSYRVDDAALVVREGKYWLYYKGRSKQFGKVGPLHTKMGVALASEPQGPYKKFDGNPVTQGGHEVLVWPQNDGVMTLLSEHGESGRTLQFSKDGFDFSEMSDLDEDYPRAPGLFRYDNFEGQVEEQDALWGISMNSGNGKAWPYLVRFEMKSD